MKTLRLILGDQLNHSHSWYANGPQPGVCYVLMEMRQETDYVRHHVQKVAAFFMAMRAFAQHLVQQGHQVFYLQLDDARNQHNLTQNLDWLISQEGFEAFEYQEPDEYRLDDQLKTYCAGLSIAHQVVSTQHFLVDRGFIRQFFRGKKTYLMETFYREMRRQHQVLMDGDEPATGRWNYDAENRKKYDGKVPVPALPAFPTPPEGLLAMIADAGVQTIGSMDGFNHPTTRAQALQLLHHFVAQCLPAFGTYEDALDQRHPNLFHSRLSFALNVKLLHPLEVCTAATNAMQAPDGPSIAQVEGFVRQIIGWREYMRGVYWAQMPGYASKNYFEAKGKLPAWFWTGETKMNCMKDCVGNSLRHAYAHHIQRLMVTGNFCLLAGTDPSQVDEWYLGIYIDAVEWVEITNTRGMSQYADGGLVATKPYAASANYINKMSNYCSNCHYQAGKRHGQGACPFNSLYWHFYERNRHLLQRNPRIGMAYRTLDAMNPEEKQATLGQAEAYLAQLDSL